MDEEENLSDKLNDYKKPSFKDKLLDGVSIGTAAIGTAVGGPVGSLASSPVVALLQSFKSNNKKVLVELLEAIVDELERYGEQIEEFIPSDDFSAFVQKSLIDYPLMNENRRKYVRNMVLNSVEEEINSSFEFDDEVDEFYIILNQLSVDSINLLINLYDLEAEKYKNKRYYRKHDNRYFINHELISDLDEFAQDIDLSSFQSDHYRIDYNGFYQVYLKQLSDRNLINLEYNSTFTRNAEFRRLKSSSSGYSFSAEDTAKKNKDTLDKLIDELSDWDNNELPKNLYFSDKGRKFIDFITK